MNKIDKTHYQLLKLFNKHQSLSAESIAAIYNGNWVAAFKLILFLEENGYVRKNSVPDNADSRTAQYSIEPSGKIALAEYCKERRYSILSEIRNWMSFIIAIATLILTWLSYSR